MIHRKTLTNNFFSDFIYEKAVVFKLSGKRSSFFAYKLSLLNKYLLTNAFRTDISSTYALLNWISSSDYFVKVGNALSRGFRVYVMNE